MAPIANVKLPLSSIVRALEEQGWPYGVVDDSMLRVSLSSEDGKWACHALWLEDDGYVAVYGIIAETTPKARWPALADLTCRANYGLLHGAFELNPDDGELRFRTSVDFDDLRANAEAGKRVLLANVITTRAYLAAFRRVVAGETDPEDALESARRKALSGS